jgi:hypothetical protein
MFAVGDQFKPFREQRPIVAPIPGIGWSACVAGIALSLGVAAALAMPFRSSAR